MEEVEKACREVKDGRSEGRAKARKDGRKREKSYEVYRRYVEK